MTSMTEFLSQTPLRPLSMTLIEPQWQGAEAVIRRVLNFS